VHALHVLTVCTVRCYCAHHNLLCLQELANIATILNQYLQAFEQPPSSLQIARQIVLPQLRRVRGDAMIRFAYGIVDSYDNVIAPAAPGPDLRALILGGQLRGQRIFGIRHDDHVMRRHFSRASVTASTAVAAAVAGGSSSSTNSAVQKISSDALWQHLQNTHYAPGDNETKRLRLIAVLAAAQLEQIRTIEHGNHSRLKYATLFIAVAQVLGAVVPHKWKQSDERRRSPFERFVLRDSATGPENVLQVAQKVFAACLAELAGAIIDTDEGSSSTNSSIDSYVQSVLQSYAVDDIVELIDSLWSGARDVHPILVGLLPRLLPINVQVNQLLLLTRLSLITAHCHLYTDHGSV
jgi:hypothetical protein